MIHIVRLDIHTQDRSASRADVENLGEGAVILPEAAVEADQADTSFDCISERFGAGLTELLAQAVLAEDDTAVAE